MKLTIQSQDLHFCSAHFLIGDEGPLEPIHGHNFFLKLEVEGIPDTLGIILDFVLAKKALLTACKKFNTKTLIAAHPPAGEWLENKKDEQIEYRLNNRLLYIIPAKDVVLLSLTNITAELLAEEILNGFYQELSMENAQVFSHVDKMELTLEESPGSFSTASKKISALDE